MEPPGQVVELVLPYQIKQLKSWYRVYRMVSPTLTTPPTLCQICLQAMVLLSPPQTPTTLPPLNSHHPFDPTSLLDTSASLDPSSFRPSAPLKPPPSHPLGRVLCTVMVAIRIPITIKRQLEEQKPSFTHGSFE